MTRAAFLALLLAGCVQVGPKSLPSVCPKADLPPIPKTVFINIEPGKPAAADDGGVALLRAYINAREALK